MISISSFKNEYRFLSNFYPSEIILAGIIFPTNEHFYQAMKAKNEKDIIKISEAKTPGEAKRLGQKILMKENWDNIKDNIMWIGLWEKFKIPELREKLIKTGNTLLIEGNNWHDNYWGRCYCEVCRTKSLRLNKLGKMLMELRELYKTLF